MRSLLVFTESYARGGGNRYMVDLVNSVSNDFGEIFLYTNQGGIFDEDKKRLGDAVTIRAVWFMTRAGIANKLVGIPAGIKRLILVLLVLVEPLFFCLNVLLLIRLTRKVKPDCILSCNGGYPASQACLSLVVVAHLCGVASIMSIVSMPTPRRKVLYAYDWMIDRLVWSSVDHVIVNAHVISDALQRSHGEVKAPISVLYNGLEDIEPHMSSRSETKFVLGYIARLDWMKGILFLLDAFTVLANRHPELKLVLAGDGDAAADVKGIVASCGLEDRVTFLGHYSGDVSELLSSFDVFVFPSLWEGFPYSIVEAMRSACAIVATDVGGIPEAIEDGNHGLLVPPGSAAAIVAAVEQLITDRGLGEVLEENARQRFERELSITEMHRHARSIIGETTAGRLRHPRT